MFRKIYGCLFIFCLGFLVACSTPVANHDQHGRVDNQIAGDVIHTQGLGPDSDLQRASLTVGNQIYYFDFDQSTVHDADLTSVQVQAHYLIQHPKRKVLLTGNTDERGSREYNIGLGQRRSEAVANLLLASGVRKQQLIVVSYGAEKPIALGHTEADYAKNRRVELRYQN